MQIDREIPYHILFLLEYENLYQAWIGYKEEAISGTAAFKVNRYFHTEWLPEQELPIKLEGLTIDAAYENFVRQIADDALRFEEGKPESLKESIERDNRRKELEKRIAVLQAKVRKEKQLNKQVQLNKDLKRLRKELEFL